MKTFTNSFLYFLVIFSFFGCKNDNNENPNIIYILADDLGYGELGSFGQTEIETPNIDKLAEDGMIFTDHYSGSPVCAPSRSVLMTGMHTGTTHIRDNSEWGERGNVWSFKAMLDNPELEGQRPLPDSIVTVAQILKNNGYKTGMVGKWGLGAPHTNSVPNNMGFDFFYGYNCQRIAHSYYPTHLWRNKERHYLNNYLVEKNEDLDLDADIYDPISYKKYNQNDYSPTLMHTEALKFIEENKNENFFLYYASLIPHLALQAPKKWEDYYRKKFGKEEPYTGKSYYPSLTPKATYAAMISYLDEQVGEIVKKLKDINKYENTLIIFTSDNGPTFLKEVDTDFFESAGKLNGSRDRLKGSVNEGGIRVPMIATWPKFIKKKTKTNHISAFQDFYATVCDILNIEKPKSVNGLSFLPTLKGENQENHKYLYWEIQGKGGQQAIRYGNWKGLKKNLLNGKQKLKLYNLDNDIQELNDMSEEFPEIVNNLEIFLKEARTTPSVKQFIIPSIE
tara:strand:+ start:5209 stop:6729 length:1521 start_codon:yes stop_codon:yes gene_type:complete